MPPHISPQLQNSASSENAAKKQTPLDRKGLEDCFTELGVEKDDKVALGTFCDVMNLYADRSGAKYTKRQLNDMFAKADWYGTGEIEMSELVDVSDCSKGTYCRG